MSLEHCLNCFNRACRATKRVCGALLERVETGPETWTEQQRLEREARYAEYENEAEEYDEDWLSEGE